ncbi:MAG: pyridoxine 5'-phosphate synthase [Brevinema sp.]
MSHRKKLGVNIDHVATLRQARGTRYPEPLQSAYIVQNAGADLLTIHPREDQRHIQKRDVYLIREACSLPLNIEMALYSDIINVVLDIAPEEVCVVPENRNEITTEGGLDVFLSRSKLEDFIPKAHNHGTKVSLFIDPDLEMVTLAHELGADMVEFHTGTYADVLTNDEQQVCLYQLIEAAKYADSLGLEVNMGHGLHYENVSPIVEIPQVRTLNIGHSIISRAIFVGLDQAVRDMKALISPFIK